MNNIKKTIYPTKFRFDSKDSKLFQIKDGLETEITQKWFGSRKTEKRWKDTMGFVLWKSKDYETDKKATYMNITPWKSDFNIFYKIYIPELDNHICFRKILLLGQNFNPENFVFEFTEADRIELIDGKWTNIHK